MGPVAAKNNNNIYKVNQWILMGCQPHRVTLGRKEREKKEKKEALSCGETVIKQIYRTVKNNNTLLKKHSQLKKVFVCLFCFKLLLPKCYEMIYHPQHGACISSAKLLAGLFFESQACLTGTAPGETNKTLLP